MGLLTLERVEPCPEIPPLLYATQRRLQSMTGLSFEVLSSMVAELVDHFERRSVANETGFDWESPSARTRVVRFGASSCLASVLSQDPEAVAKEFQLSYCGVLIFNWNEYRWPHLLSEDRKVPDLDYIDLPQNCIDELMDYHITMQTSWLYRYQTAIGNLDQNGSSTLKSCINKQS